MLPPPDHGPLMALAIAADAHLAAAGIDGAILYVSDLAPAGRPFTWIPLDGAHPLDVLMGFRAPAQWRVLGVSCTGRAHRLDGGDDRPPGATDGGHEVAVALLLDRQDASAGLMRAGQVVTPLPERPVGTVADACRRALGLATGPPPPSTLELWTLAWLDRVVEVAAADGGRARLGTWAQVAGLHAAVGPLTGTTAGASGPGALAASARALADAWPWARLRADPRVAPVPGGPPSAALAAWMDDGMWARWLLGRFPAVDDLVTAVHALLPAVLAEGVDRVVRAAGG